MISSQTPESNLSLSLTFPETNQSIRVAGTAERPEWVAKDICDVLEIGNPSKALVDFDDSEKGGITIGNTPLLTVTEPGLYRLVTKSRKPAAQAFKQWIFHEVLPSIRAHGCYPAPLVPRNPSSIMLRQLADSLDRQDQLEIQQTETAQKLESVVQRVQDMDGDTGYATLLAYTNLKGISLPRNLAQKYGKALTKIHRKRKIKIGRVSDERHGKVNAYRVELIEEYFENLPAEEGGA